MNSKYWVKRRRKLEDLNKRMKKAFGVYASWKFLLNMPAVFSQDSELQGRADRERARIQAKADGAYRDYEKIKAEIEFFVYGDMSAVVPVKSPVPEKTVSQRAQIVVEKYEWVENGGDRRSEDFSKDFSASRNSKNRCSGARTKNEMAKIANCSLAAIDRAKQVSRMGLSDKVIRGEKSASAAIAEERENKAARRGKALRFFVRVSFRSSDLIFLK